MTTTPAPADIDTLKALEQAAAHAPWIVQDANEDYPHEYGAYWVLTKPDAESDDTIMELRSGFRADAELVAAMRNALPALLDELANERWLRENAGKVCDSAVAATHEIAKQRDAALDELATERRQGAAMASITGEAIRQIAEERDAAREELAKTRAELEEAKQACEKLTLTVRAFPHADNAANIAHARAQRDAYWAELAKTRADLAATHAELERLCGVIREGVDMAEWHRNEVTTWKRKSAKLREQLGNAKARISAAATVEVWTNEDGKRFVFADDLMRALDPNPEANPATTAEPADEPKADHDECDGTDHPGMTCDQYDTALEPTPPGQLVLAPLTDEPKATCNGNCIYHLGEVVVEDLCCPLHGVEAEPAAG